MKNCEAANQYTQTAKIGLFYVKFNAQLNEISFFFLKATESDEKMAKTKVLRKSANWRRSKCKI